MRRSLIIGVVVLGLTGLFAVACGGGSSSGSATGGSATQAAATGGGGTTITAGLTEFAIALNAKTAKAGAVTFTATNKGTTPHELLVIKSDLAEDKLPLKDAAVNVSGLTVTGTVAQMESGKGGSGTFTLAAGKYILICNVPAHYQAGMHAAFTVQ